MRNPDWYYDLVAGAAEAQELYSTDELEDYEAKWRETEEGKKWIALVSTFTWNIGKEE